MMPVVLGQTLLAPSMEQTGVGLTTTVMSHDTEPVFVVIVTRSV